MTEPKIISQFLDSACLRYDGHDCPETRLIAENLLTQHPDLASANLYTAACLALPEVLGPLLAKDKTLANRKGGPRHWPPLLYLTYGRISLETDDARADAMETLELLLNAGADPNAYYLVQDLYVFTAVTGALGNGEGGPIRQPPHAYGFAMAERLLAAGADPNDGQALYNWMQTNDDERCLQLCLKHGLRAEHTINWDRDGKIRTLDYLLTYAVGQGLTDRCRFLLQHGADAATADSNGTSLYRLAVRHSYNEVADILAGAGATLDITLCDRFFGACFSSDLAAINELSEANPDLIDALSQSDRTILHQVAARGAPEVLDQLLTLGFHVDEREPTGYRHTPLHKAAMNGRHEMVSLLLKRGADRDAVDATYQGTPCEWAKHHGFEAIASLIAAWPNS